MLTAALQRRLSQPGTYPEQDIFIAWEGPEARGCLLMSREERGSRAVATGGVLPGWRRRGIGQRLLSTVIDHARGLGLRVLHVDVPANGAAAKASLTKAGFSWVRTHRHLLRESTTLSGVAGPPGYTARLLEPDETEALTALQNAVFTGSWGYSPNTVEEIQYRLSELNEKPEEVVVLEQSGRLVAYCWTHGDGDGQPGRIEMMGVHPLHQRKGLGRFVTGAGIDHLLRSGARPIGLTVDSENSAAVRMYEGLGFQLDWESHWYELQLRA